tara:strand:- start:3143 stop:3328 length:186 start_codon:yes stop_codon:yes gene_type:complete
MLNQHDLGREARVLIDDETSFSVEEGQIVYVSAEFFALRTAEGECRIKFDSVSVIYLEETD